MRDDEGRPQGMQCLAFIELAQEAAPILRMGVAMHGVHTPATSQPARFAADALGVSARGARP
jgi:hypothetical protein